LEKNVPGFHHADKLASASDVLILLAFRRGPLELGATVGAVVLLKNVGSKDMLEDAIPSGQLDRFTGCVEHRIQLMKRTCESLFGGYIGILGVVILVGTSTIIAVTAVATAAAGSIIAGRGIVVVAIALVVRPMLLGLGSSTSATSVLSLVTAVDMWVVPSTR
jgi:hypothetical protein